MFGRTPPGEMFIAEPQGRHILPERRSARARRPLLLGLVVAGLVAGAGATVATSLSAQANATWTATGNLVTARSGATATLLGTGKVLVAGGNGGGSTALSAAELYDPGTGSWSATAAMATARTGHTATLLQNGMVLVAGPDTSAEVYDPTAGTWSPTHPMVLAPGAGASATLLQNGSVLVAGGCCGNSGGLPSGLTQAQLYDPATGAWTATGSLATGRAQHTASLLPDGTVLVVGGRTIVKYNSGGITSTELYDPRTGTWHAGPASPTPHALGTATTLKDGRILLAGGAHDGCCSGLAGADLFDPATGTWAAAAPMGSPREDMAAGLLPDGSVLVAGGYQGITPTPVLASAEVYNPSANTWTTVPAMSTPREALTLTTLPNGSVLAAGGLTGTGNAVTASAELFGGTVSPPPPPAPVPTVTAISPTSGPTAGGTVVTVTGTNLAGGGVRFGSTPATSVSCGATSCTATSPAGTGTVDVSVTTAAGTSAAVAADAFSYQAPPPPPPGNLVPDPGFETAAVPGDRTGSTLARTTAPVHGGRYALAQTARSTVGGWDLDRDAAWRAPVSAGRTYTATIWVRSTTAARVTVAVDLLDADGVLDVRTNGTAVTLTPNTWTQLKVGVTATDGDVWAAVRTGFSGTRIGSVLVWDDMSLS